MAEERKDMPPTGEQTTPLRDFVEHQRKAVDEACQALSALLPPDFRTHSRTAREEFMLSFKVLADGVAAAVDRELNKMRTSPSSGSGGGPSTTGKSKVKVEVS